LTSGGAVKCWGDNLAGQLGDGTTENRLTPVDVPGLAGNAAVLEAGAYHTCLLLSQGNVQCWGGNADGELGDGTTIERHAPAAVTGLPGAAVALTAGTDHTCALLSAGVLQCWGGNFYGQLGDGTANSFLAPVLVAGLPGGAAEVAAGRFHTCALTPGGGVKCWGLNADGQLGDGTTNTRGTPGDVSGLSSGMAAVTTGREYSCALTAGGGLKCWGYNSAGQLGDGTTDDRALPGDVVGLSEGVWDVEAGAWHACAVTSGGAAKCWGFNFWWQLGDGTTEDRPTPVDVAGLSSGVTAIAAGAWHSCALTAGGAVKCWGRNWDGELGNGSGGFSPAPVAVAGLSAGVTAIAAGEQHTCALLAEGAVKCWGLNSSGQLGDGTLAQGSTPVAVTGLSGPVVAIAAGAWHTCALTASGEVQCWGNNYYKQLGDGTRIGRTAAVRVAGLTGTVLSLAAGESYSCAVTSEGVQCWGNNLFGQLGNGTAGFRPTPAAVVNQTFVDVTNDYWAADFVEQLYVAGITDGCGSAPLRYCPDAIVTRAQMAVFLLRSLHGSTYTPPALGEGAGFGDVPDDHWAAAWITELAAQGITDGCGGGDYCPEQAVTRAQIAVFLLRAKYGPGYAPPVVGNETGIGDVPVDHWAAAWIKQLAAEGITAGCGGGNYCPEAPVTRAQMAVFLVRTFDLP
jgi:alpha-tubulin suppressor-like RCC1 family protein